MWFFATLEDVYPVVLGCAQVGRNLRDAQDRRHDNMLHRCQTQTQPHARIEQQHRQKLVSNALTNCVVAHELPTLRPTLKTLCDTSF